jgi:hypothetical protein
MILVGGKARHRRLYWALAHAWAVVRLRRWIVALAMIASLSATLSWIHRNSVYSATVRLDVLEAAASAAWPLPSPARDIASNLLIRISLLKSGKVLADQQEVSVEELANRLSRVKVAWVYDEGSPIRSEINKALGKYSIGEMRSSRPDFSDFIDVHGQSHPTY